jgi:hypothetical protein
MAADDLTTLDSLKAWLAIPSARTADDALLARLITAASAYIESWLGRRLGLAAYTETRDGTGGQRLAFMNAPVQLVDAVMVDGVAIQPSSGAPQAGYLYDDRFVTLIGRRFTRGESNVVLAYTAGFVSIPPEIEQACIELAALRYRERDHIGQSSKGLGGESVSFSQKDMSDDIKTILGAYRRIVYA